MENDFIGAAKDIINIPKSHGTFVKRWTGAFGAPVVVCCRLWGKLDPFHTMPNGVAYKHLLWALYFLKVYETEHNSASSVGKVDEKTYREWSWRFVEAISYLECDVVSQRPFSFFECLLSQIFSLVSYTNNKSLISRSYGTIVSWVTLATGL